MTPQLQQAIRLLQLSRLELIREIREELEKNPMLAVSESDRALDLCISRDAKRRR